MATTTTQATTTCRSCGATMKFGITDKGRRMPLDADPHPDGAWAVDEEGFLYRADASTLPTERHRSHFETCPQGKGWSRKNRKGGK